MLDVIDQEWVLDRVDYSIVTKNSNTHVMYVDHIDIANHLIDLQKLYIKVKIIKNR